MEVEEGGERWVRDKNVFFLNKKFEGIIRYRHVTMYKYFNFLIRSPMSRD